MARKVQVLLVDDLDGKELGDQGETVAFGLAGERYEIDLSQDNAKKFRDMLGAYVEHARNVTRQGGGRRRAGSTSRRSSMDREQSLAVREWARHNGWPDLPGRGRIPAEVTEAYHSRSQTKAEGTSAKPGATSSQPKIETPKTPSLQVVKGEVPKAKSAEKVAAKVNGISQTPPKSEAKEKTSAK